ncbi:hypothetical protein [Kitasatospora sp. NPDC001527]|uniref:hypothetical protein n=1 Tax=Kitasatospora sp. NPDC001527 TaxID=3154519 RepID=UPI00332C0E8B
MNDSFTHLGTVTAPSGVLVFGMSLWVDHWPQVGRPLSERAREAAARGAGGGHLMEDPAEAVAVAVDRTRALAVRARTAPSPFDDEPAISVLEVELAIPWPEGREAPVPLGDLPVDRGGMLLGDAVGLDSWIGLDGEPADGLADVTYWGRDEDEAHERFGGERIPQFEGDERGSYGLLDLPLDRARALAAEIENHGAGVVSSVAPHTDFHRLECAGRTRPLTVGAIEVGGCPVLGFGWCQGDHAVRHHGERAWGRVYPVTLDRDANGGTVLRWSIPAWDEEDEGDEVGEGGRAA